MATMGTLCFVTQTLRNPPMEIEEILETYVAQVVLTNARLAFWGTFPNFSQGAKAVILSKILDKVLIWRLTVPQWEGISEIENNRVHY